MFGAISFIFPGVFEKFEDYVIRELGLKKPLALKLVKTYFFVEQDEPVYLKKEFAEVRENCPDSRV